jgi:hypothetical protein
MATTEYPYLDLRAKLAEIDRALAQTAQARTDVLRATAQIEQANADAARKRQENRYQPIIAMISGMTAGAALLAAGAAFTKIFGG